MGKLIEISIVGTNKSLYAEMLNFLEQHLSNNNEDLSLIHI